MVANFASLIQVLAQTTEDKIWPTSIAGWVPTIGLGALVFDRLWNRGKKEGVDEGTLNGIGARVTVVEASFTRADARLDELERRADKSDLEMRAAVGDISRLEAKVDQMLSQGTENKLEIIGEFQRIATEVRTGFHELDVKVERMAAVADERERAGTGG